MTKDSQEIKKCGFRGKQVHAYAELTDSSPFHLFAI